MLVRRAPRSAEMFEETRFRTSESRSDGQDLDALIKLAKDMPSTSLEDEKGTSNSLPADPTVEEMRKYILSREGVQSVEFLAKGGQGTAFVISMNDGAKRFGKVIDVVDIKKHINYKAELRETLAGKGLRHERIPRLHVTESFNEDTQYLLIRDYVAGVSLKELIQQKGRLSSEEAKGYLRQCLELLEYLHDTRKHREVGQVIHRDVKPGNIIIDGAGKLFLVDFGCAHFRTQHDQSMTTCKMGTEGYRSGEQHIGGALASSDLYSLGITILEGLIADRPLLVEELKKNWFNDTIGKPFEIPSDLEICPRLRLVLQKMIKANSDERYKSASEAVAALDRPESVGFFGYLKGIFNWRRMFNLSTQRQTERAPLAVGELVSVDGHRAVVGKIPVNGQQLDTLLTEGSFDKSRAAQIAYAQQLGYRMATREEHIAYVRSLLAKERDESINGAEKKALNTYRERYVQDTEGGLAVIGRRVVDDAYRWDGYGDPSDGALFVRDSISAEVTTAPKTSLQIAQEMIDSYVFDKTTGVSTFTVPAGVTDVEAMKAVNEYFRKKSHFWFKRDAVYAGDLEWYKNLPKQYSEHCQERDYSQARQITITGVVKGTKGENRTTQRSVLKDESLIFSDPRDQALAAAIHACKHNGEDLFQDISVRGSVPGFVLRTWRFFRVSVSRYGGSGNFNVAASGSPSPELK